MANRIPDPPRDNPSPDVVAEVAEEMLKRVKETAEAIEERVKKATEETGELAKLDTQQHPPYSD